MRAPVLHVFDPIFGRRRSLCTDCIESWKENGYQAPDTRDGWPSQLPCENCALIAAQLKEDSELPNAATVAHRENMSLSGCLFSFLLAMLFCGCLAVGLGAALGAFADYGGAP